MAAKIQRRETGTEHQLTEPSSHPKLQQQSRRQGTNCKTNNHRRGRTHRRSTTDSASASASVSAPRLPSSSSSPTVATVVTATPAPDQQQPSSTVGPAVGETAVIPGGDESLCSALQRVTIVVLGARGVGKTSLVRQFVYGDVGDGTDDVIGGCRRPKADLSRTGHVTTPPPNNHHVAVVVDRRLYDVRLVDCPPISRFPTSAVQEWTDYRGYGLRHAAAYVIVYDVTDDESFAYVRSMREQIVRCRAASGPNGTSTGSGMSSGGGSGSARSNAASGSSATQFDVPIIVAANKVDLTIGGGGVVGLNGTGHVVGNLVNGGGDKNGLSSATAAGRLQRDAANVVRKQWKCAYVECSARYNWRVVTLFRDLMKSVDHAARQQHHHHHHAGYHHHGSHLQSAAGSLIRVQDALHNNHCNIL